MMQRLLLFSWALVAVVVGPDSIPLDQKLRMIFDDMDSSNNQQIILSEFVQYFLRFRHNPHADFVECFHFQHDWHSWYGDPVHIGAQICVDYFDTDGDQFLHDPELAVLFAKLDINPEDGSVDYDEFDVYFRKMYNDLGIHSK